MTRTRHVLLAAGGSAALLLAALGSQYLGGLAPCEMCLWQRWPHGAAVAIGAVALAVSGPALPLLGAAAAAATGGIGVYHTGVERDWWQGPSGCSSGDISNLSTGDLMEQIMTAPLVRCDEVAWEFLSLSMASWNALLSFALTGLWIAAAARR